MVTNLLIAKFSELIEGLNMMKSAGDTSKKLQEKLLGKYINTIVSYITPVIPLVGIIKGGLTVAGDIVSHKMTEQSDIAEINKHNELP